MADRAGQVAPPRDSGASRRAVSKMLTCSITEMERRGFKGSAPRAFRGLTRRDFGWGIQSKWVDGMMALHVDVDWTT